MSVLLETSLGDLVIDLDLDGSPVLCRNFLKLCQVRYYTQTLLAHHVVPNRFVVAGDPTGTGHGGTSFFGLLLSSSEEGSNNEAKILDKNDKNHQQQQHRFLKSSGRRLTEDECREKGRVVAVELYGVPNTVGSQFLITTASGPDRALDGYSFAHATKSSNKEEQQANKGFLSLGKVVEDDNHLLDRLADCYADRDGRPWADWRIQRALVVYDPYDDPKALRGLLQQRGVEWEKETSNNNNENNNSTTSMRVIRSPSPERPPEETIPPRVPIEDVPMNDLDGDVDPLQEAQFHQELQRKQDKSRAVVLEMLGDLPDADITAPENVLFICKLNAVTTDEDLQLILSRFDEHVQVEIVRDHDTGQSLNYAFAEFTTKEQATQAYLKMNQALVDDRRIIVDFSQSVAKLWDRHKQRYRQKPPQQAQSRGNSGGGGGGGGGGGQSQPQGGRRGQGPLMLGGGGGGQPRAAAHHHHRGQHQQQHNREPTSSRGGRDQRDRGGGRQDDNDDRYESRRRHHHQDRDRGHDRDEEEERRSSRSRHHDRHDHDHRDRDRRQSRGRDREYDDDDDDDERGDHRHHRDREDRRRRHRRTRSSSSERDRGGDWRRDKDRKRHDDDDNDRRKHRRDDGSRERERRDKRHEREHERERRRDRDQDRRDRDHHDRRRSERDRDEKQHKKRSRKHY